LIAYAVWTAASIFVLQLQTIAGLQQYQGASLLMTSRDEAVRLTVTAKKMLDTIGKNSKGISHIISVLHDQISMLGFGIDDMPATWYQHETSGTFVEPLSSTTEAGLDFTDFPAFEMPVDFNATNDGREQFLETLMQTFLN
jgi:hypothetical protein